MYGGERHLFFFNDTATTEIYTLSLHDALPIHRIDVRRGREGGRRERETVAIVRHRAPAQIGRAHVWNSSHLVISYAVFCLKKKKKKEKDNIINKKKKKNKYYIYKKIIK